MWEEEGREEGGGESVGERERRQKEGGGEKGSRIVSLKLCEESGNVPGAGMRERKRLAWRISSCS